MESLALIKILSLIALLLVLFYAFFILAQKRRPISGTKKRLGVLEYQRIDHKNSLCLVRADAQEFIIAMGPANITIYPIGTRE